LQTWPAPQSTSRAQAGGPIGRQAPSRQVCPLGQSVLVAQPPTTVHAWLMQT
jgi:hypothetical protein